MRSHFNPQSTANTIMMLRTRFRGSFLLLEGDTDIRFFSNLTNYAICRQIPTYGKVNAIHTLIELEKRGAKGMLAIVDADYWTLEGIKPGNNLLLTDTHDLETMILLSPALEKVLREYVPGERMDRIQQIAQSVRQALISVGMPIGYLRWVSIREKCELNFDSLPYTDLIDPKSLVVDIDKMIHVVTVVSRYIPLHHGDLRKKIDELSAKQSDPWHVCQGHDLIFMMEIVIPLIFERLLGCDISERVRRILHASRLDENLRLAYENGFFVKTTLYTSIKNWELANPPYQVLNC